MSYLVENVDATYVVENEALYNTCHRWLKIPYPNFEDYNYLISCQMSDITSWIRFKTDQGKK